MASGRTNYYDKKTHEWYDTVMAVYEYQTSQGPVTAFYQTLSTNSCNGYFESFMGTEGTLVISEASHRGEAYKEPRTNSNAWIKWIRMNYLKAPEDMEAHERELALPMYVNETPPPLKRLPYKLPIEMDKPVHQPHLENFFDAVRGKAKLSCHAEVGYETAVSVLKVNTAVEAGRKLDFDPAEFNPWQNPA